MILAVLSRYGDGKRFLYDLLVNNHEPKIRKRRHQRRAISMYRSLREAGIVQETGTLDTSGRAVTLGFDLQVEPRPSPAPALAPASASAPNCLPTVYPPTPAPVLLLVM